MIIRKSNANSEKNLNPSVFQRGINLQALPKEI